MIEQQELWCVRDDLEFQRVLLQEMGELLPAKLLEECDLSRARSALEIGSGTGRSRLDPYLDLIGPP